MPERLDRLYEWKEKFWGRRYQAIVVSNEEEAQIDRLEYILSNGVKEGLVERPQDWPGAHSVNALLTGEPLEGLWFDRTKEYAARRRGEDFDPLAYATVEILTLDPLPCWRGLSEDVYRQRIASLITQIEEKARTERERTGQEFLGHEAILSQDPQSKPSHSKKSPAPRFHAFRKNVRRELYEAYAWFRRHLSRCFGEVAIRRSDGKVSVRKLSSRSSLRLVNPGFTSWLAEVCQVVARRD